MSWWKGIQSGSVYHPPVDPNTGLPLRQGTTPRNFLRGFGAAQWDFAVHRDFPIRESLKLQFRIEMFNVLNHPNFGQPSGELGVGGFGVSSQMLGRSLSAGNLGGGALSPLSNRRAALDPTGAETHVLTMNSPRAACSRN